MKPLSHVRARSLIAALSLSLTALATSPVVALATTAPECDPVAADATTSAARGPAGKLLEPVLAQAGKEAPKGPANRPGFNQTIPVYFHVISNGTDGAVSMGTIAEQMDVLNKSYAGKQGGANTGFKFSLAGVNFATNAAWFDAGPGSAEEAAMKQALKQGGPGDMNVYTTSGNLYLGWAYFPSIVGSNFEYLDGVVIDFRSMPGGPYGDAFSLGGTLTHEAGHYLGLYHTFEGGCGTKGDLVADTPAQRTPTGGCPEGKDTCTGKPGLDPIHNYMDYSFDSCYNQFTAGQGSRMQDQFLAFRD